DEASLRGLADVATGVPSSRAASMLLDHLQTVPEDRATTARYVYHVARYVRADQRGTLYALAKRSTDRELADQLVMLRALHQGIQDRAGEWPDSLVDWPVQLAQKLIDSNESASVGEAIELARAMKLKALEDTLVPIAAGKTPWESQRSGAIGALAAIDSVA